MAGSARIAALVLCATCLLPAGCRTVVYEPSRDLPYMVFSDESWEDVKALSDEIGAVFALYSALFQVDERDLGQLFVRMEIRGAADGAGGEDYPALYRTNPARIFFLKQPDRALLLHEIAHHFIPARLGRAQPTCLNEGLATYLGWSAVGESGLIPGEIAVEHSRVARRAALAGGLIPLADFLAVSPEEFYTLEQRSLNYSQAWAFVYFLLHEHLPQDLPFHAKIDRLRETAPADLAALDADFKAYCREFPALDALLNGLGSNDDVRRCSSAFRLGLLQDGRAADPLLDLALNPEESPAVREVALLAAGVIFLGPDGEAAWVRFQSAIRSLANDPDPGMREGARLLTAAVQRGDAAAIQKRFGAAGCNTPFYPPGRIRVTYR